MSKEQEVAQLKAQRLMLLGALSEDAELKAAVDAAHAELTAVVEKHGPAAQLAAALLTIDIAIKESTT